MKKKCFKLEQYVERVYCDDCGKVIELHSNFKKGD